MKLTQWQVIQWLYKRLQPHLWLIILLSVVTVVYSLSGIVSIFIIRQMIDAATQQKEALIWQSVWQWLLIYGLQLAMNVGLSALDDHLRLVLETDLRQHLLRHLLKLPYATLQAEHSGSWLTRLFSDVDYVVNGMVTLINSVVSNSVRLVGALVALYFLQPWLVAVSIVGGTIIGIISLMLKRPLKQFHRRLQENRTQLRAHLQEILRNTLVIKAFQVEQGMMQRHEQLQATYRQSRVQRRYTAIAVNGSLNIISQVGRMLGLLWGVLALYRGSMTYGTLVALLQLLNQVAAPISSVAGIGGMFQNMTASAERLIECEQMETELTVFEALAKQPPTFQSLTLEHVSFSYGELPVLRDFSDTLERGDRVALMGQSGIGKSTLFSLLLGIYQPEDGSLYVITEDGSRLAYHSLTLGELRAYFSYVPQGHGLFSGTIRENIAFFQPDCSDERLWQALEVAQLDEFVRGLPQQLESTIGEQGSQLSEGQKQRLAIARAFATEAPILLLDEATSALDEATERQVLENLAQQQRTLILITHRTAVLAICNKQIQLKPQQALEEEEIA